MGALRKAPAKEFAMAKGQKRSNREVRKPKTAKPKAKTATPTRAFSPPPKKK
jgi:hypothetical protein